ncbi:non-specific lipid transfer protein GPI-anchored 5 [Ziziphus jujuba]|uniref:Non-specific lipid-transfer protein-like protein At2g13820 n=2 Tax=Ziziphus jujuba TaxID=326968 RepID=A0A6P3Z1S3_ZIZJJ|nr:non-specific lipid transfer protein GPI-anchored 5 [Ziziphus jujuba]KAH7522292.1 hypothetical protein FEM48_Zijuj07G0122800 [Ziziphus jujuba var. spinosa]
MAQKIVIGLVLVLVPMFWASASAQSSSCTNVLISLSPCLDYITGNSSTPSSDCCTQLASVVRSSPQCLCEVLNGGGASLGINVNRTLALALPGACKVETPPLSRCDAASPSDSPAGSPESSNTDPSGKGNVPSTKDGSSDGSSIKLSTPLLFLALFAATYASTFTTY